MSSSKKQSSEIVIKGTHTPLTIRLSLSIILAICFVMPIAVTIAVLTNGIGPHFLLAILFFFFWGIGFYILRIILWNTFGREILSLKNDKITYIADYKYFKDGYREIELKGLKVEIISSNMKNKDCGLIGLFNYDSEILTVLEANLEKLKAIKDQIEAHLEDNLTDKS